MFNTVKRYSCFIAQFMVVLIITLLLLEGAGLYVYFRNHNEIYYLKSEQPDETGRQSNSTENILQTKHILHPYLGFIFRPSLPMSRVAGPERMRKILEGGTSDPDWKTLKANNHGFFSRFNYPYNAENDKILIGIFGGSVGQWFALQGSEKLKRELQKHPFFRDRDIIVLNYSQGGFKQPQQVQALSYFLAIGQRFDLVVNIDGFNELALSHINHQKNIGTSMPSAQHILPLLNIMGRTDIDMELLDKLYTLSKFKKKLKRIEHWKSSTDSAALYLILSVIYTRTLSQYSAKQEKSVHLSTPPERTEFVHLSELPADFSINNTIRASMDLWLGSAVMMQQICNARGIPYLEIIQPNQYFSKKQFSDKEQKLAFNKNSPYSEAIKQGYPYLPDIIRPMQQEGINLRSAVDIFDKIRVPTYSDNCCHYNQTGNEVLADRVAEFIVSLVEKNTFRMRSRNTNPDKVR